MRPRTIAALVLIILSLALVLQSVRALINASTFDTTVALSAALLVSAALLLLAGVTLALRPLHA
jgi:uncharacterized membrane protein YcjF (UPF0283 family)